jgi:3-oxoacyl-[acyl-carrier-protein] synthase-3
MVNKTTEEVDYFVFHQSNKFIMKHLMKKCGLAESQVPLVLEEFGNAGGPSVALAITRGVYRKPLEAEISMMLLGYGVGLSWSAGLVQLDAEAVVQHAELSINEFKTYHEE